MKIKSLAFILLAFCGGVAMAQKTEFSAKFHSGFAYLTGDGTEGTTAINYDAEFSDGYTNNPFGSRPGLSYGAALSIERITKHRIIFGLSAGYELLRARANVTQVWVYAEDINATVDAEGKTILSGSNLVFQPNLGCRIPVGSSALDVKVGLDFVKIFSVEENGHAETDDFSVTTTSDRKAIDSDARFAFEVDYKLNRWSIFACYAFGVNSYKEVYDGGSTTASMKVLKIGVGYLIW